ncbi:P2R1A-PPP2R2A-interacting phosphatase regulator 1-like isoform X1 [Haliotis rufescens]|uniref:P2R1A-PPP2R2A-interacting phosphatase regulator 1-like isoform X1 n=1 Tax=Haliotis rufescens TaxID=6454 RepID=UPI001EAFD178|nr:P2R1A-PPP2R2A-interacting phosphatase regulator 1-like isoform X1 [Haliotis rufescens]
MMEVDHDPQANSSAMPGVGTLKRSNSAPMINALLPTSNAETSTSTFKSTESSRIRRFSSSNMSLSSLSTPLRVPDRINQIKIEESHIPDREAAHEREMRNQMQISTSWDGFNLVCQSNVEGEMLAEQTQRRPRSFSESLHIMTSPSLLCGSPSPTRLGKQCFSPSMQIPIRNHSFTPSPSPSPTRKSFMRSLSPIAVRPSPLGKRKLESDNSDRFEYLSPPKKFHTGPSTPDRIIPHPLAHSISSSSLEDHSPEQTVPRGPGAVIDQSHPSKTHMFGFMPLRDSHDIHMTDSEASDITESVDISDSPAPVMTNHTNPSATGFTPIKQTHV